MPQTVQMDRRSPVSVPKVVSSMKFSAHQLPKRLGKQLN